MSSISSKPSRLRRLWKPVLTAGTGGAGIAVCHEEVVALAMEFLGAILVICFGGLICLFDHLVFKARTPQRDDK